jgi:hypothetical protein
MSEIVQAADGVVVPPVSEKTFSQAEVNDIAHKTRKEAEERVLKSIPASAPALDEAKMREMMREEAAKVQFEQTQQYAVNRMVTDLQQRTVNAKEKYPDFDEKVASLNLPKKAGLVPYLLAVDNTDDVLYELSQFPEKAHAIASMAREGDHEGAQSVMSRLSKSIKDNNAARQNTNTPKEPLSQLKPSAVTGDSGELTMADFKKMFRG